MCKSDLFIRLYMWSSYSCDHPALPPCFSPAVSLLQSICSRLINLLSSLHSRVLPFKCSPFFLPSATMHIEGSSSLKNYLSPLPALSFYKINRAKLYQRRICPWFGHDGFELKLCDSKLVNEQDDFILCDFVIVE